MYAGNRGKILYFQYKQRAPYSVFGSWSKVNFLGQMWAETAE